MVLDCLLYFAALVGVILTTCVVAIVVSLTVFILHQVW